MHFKDMVAFYSAIGSSLLSGIQVLILGSVYGKVLIIAHYTIFSTKDIKSKENVTPHPILLGFPNNKELPKLILRFPWGSEDGCTSFFGQTLIWVYTD